MRKIKSIPTIWIEKTFKHIKRKTVIKANLVLALILNLISSKKPMKNKKVSNPAVIGRLTADSE